MVNVAYYLKKKEFKRKIQNKLKIIEYNKFNELFNELFNEFFR